MSSTPIILHPYSSLHYQLNISNINLALGIIYLVINLTRLKGLICIFCKSSFNFTLTFLATTPGYYISCLTYRSLLNSSIKNWLYFNRTTVLYFSVLIFHYKLHPVYNTGMISSTFKIKWAWEIVRNYKSERKGVLSWVDMTLEIICQREG